VVRSCLLGSFKLLEAQNTPCPSEAVESCLEVVDCVLETRGGALDEAFDALEVTDVGLEETCDALGKALEPLDQALET